MKNINLQIATYNDYVNTERVCSHGDCGQELRGDENFCPKCGAKLNPIPDKLDKKAIIALVNENIDRLQNPQKAEVQAEGEDKSPTPDVREDDNGHLTQMPDDSSPMGISTCPHLKGRPEDCGLCSPNGACMFTKLCSFPPQYRICPFRGSGFIDCSEA